jgi:hypothetical protein
MNMRCALETYRELPLASLIALEFVQQRAPGGLGGIEENWSGCVSSETGMGHTGHHHEQNVEGQPALARARLHRAAWACSEATGDRRIGTCCECVL